MDKTRKPIRDGAISKQPSPLPCARRDRGAQQMTDTQQTVNAMREFNALIELADRETDYEFDRLSVQELAAKLKNLGLPLLAKAIETTAIELGLWRR